MSGLIAFLMFFGSILLLQIISIPIAKFHQAYADKHGLIFNQKRWRFERKENGKSKIV